MVDNNDRTTCCIVGGGPAGIFLGYLLARSGVDVVVLEKHGDFLRDFRGDTIHPSTLELLDELGLLDEFLPISDFRAEALRVSIGGQRHIGPVFSHLTTKCKFIAFAPQWDFLNLLCKHARRYAEFDIRMNTKATDVVRENGRVVGVRCTSDELQYEIGADLVVAADGRSSTIRQATGHHVDQRGIPIDVLWFRLDYQHDVETDVLGWFQDGHMLVAIPRRDHFQVARIIEKGSFEEIKSQGLASFTEAIATICPPLGPVAGSVTDWQDVKVLTVQINRMAKWYEPGLLFIGDAAHAMSPIGGVGINLAVQDAVAAANLLSAPLRDKTVSEADLAAVQRRREPAARKTQRLQSLIHWQLFGKDQPPGKPISISWYVRLFARLFAPLLRRLAGRIIGIGFQPEHIQTRAESHSTRAP